jgi:hypothetical protein
MAYHVSFFFLVVSNTLSRWPQFNYMNRWDDVENISGSDYYKYDSCHSLLRPKTTLNEFSDWSAMEN